jgi:MFS family permease
MNLAGDATLLHSPEAAMAKVTSANVSTISGDRQTQLFLGCFIALITTAFGFISRMFLLPKWGVEFDLDPAQQGRLAGIGIWPFAVSIIGFSLFIDRIGYKTAMCFAFLGHIVWMVMGVGAYFVSQQGNSELAFSLLYWGSLVLALGNGTVEAFINPVVATVYSNEKTKWLNILHAGWPGGLVLAGMLVIFLDAVPWWIKIALIAIPAVIYFLMLIPLQFPVSERVASGVNYRSMLAEFGTLGALIVGFLLTLQLMDFFSNGSTTPLADWQRWAFIGIGVAVVAAFAAYTRSFGRPLLFFLVLIMMPLATTEIGTDGWITGIMEGVFKQGNYNLNPGWILVYTSVIMMVLRFFAGPIVHSLSPLGLLAVSSVLAIAGLYLLSFSTGLMIFAAATLYALGKTFFWPTMLGVVSEQTPRGGALTLNAISGIGMLTVGTLGFPYIGALQANRQIEMLSTAEGLATEVPALFTNGQLNVVQQKSIYEIINYQTISPEKLAAALADASPEARARVENLMATGQQRALANMTVFPAIMLAGYIILMAYFRARGGYQAEVLTGHAAEDARFTGGVAGAMEG